MICFDLETSRKQSRPGAVVVAVVALLAIVMMLLASWAQVALSDLRQSRGRYHMVQAARLAESGGRRALARLQIDPTYEGETWELTADELGQSRGAVVRIVAQHQEDATEEVLLTVTADYPADSLRRARRTFELRVQPSESSSNPPKDPL